MPSEVRLAELEKLLRSHGWSLVRISGSHHIFSKPGRTPIVLPVHRGKVKPAYVRQVKKLLEGQ